MEAITELEARRVAPRGGRGGRVVLLIAAFALVASAAFSIGEVRGAQHRNQPVIAAPTAGPVGLSGLSIAGLENLAGQLRNATNLAKAAGNANDLSGELSQLEQQLGISPSTPTAAQADQLQAELNTINACLSGDATAMPTSC